MRENGIRCCRYLRKYLITRYYYRPLKGDITWNGKWKMMIMSAGGIVGKTSWAEWASHPETNWEKEEAGSGETPGRRLVAHFPQNRGLRGRQALV